MNREAFPDLQSIRELLTAWSHSPGKAIALEAVESSGFSGALLWRMETDDRRQWCLRCWPESGPDPERLRWIHATVAAAAARLDRPRLSVPLPRDDGQASWVHQHSRLWEIGPWLEGVRWEPQWPIDPVRKQEAILGCGELFRIWRELAGTRHLTGATDLPDPAPEIRIPRPSPAALARTAQLQTLDRDLDEVRSSRMLVPLDPGLVREALRALPRLAAGLIPAGQLLSDTAFFLQPVLTDLWHGNLLFDDAGVCGIVDYGSLQYDVPAVGLARLAGGFVFSDLLSGATTFPGGWTAENDWTEWTAMGRAKGLGPSVRAEVLEFFCRTSIVLGCRNWLQWLFVHHRSFANPESALHRARCMLAAAAGMAGS